MITNTNNIAYPGGTFIFFHENPSKDMSLGSVALHNSFIPL
jgi:hypothetical protein